MHFELIEGHSLELVPLVRELFREYAVWLGVDLYFQDFEMELATLPGKYASPGGAILLCYADGVLAGCVAMRPLTYACCEMKRLWLREPFRGRGLGALLTQSILAQARRAGYRRMRLDTLPHMRAALTLYRRLGFEEIAPYYPNPLPGTVYLEKVLTGQAPNFESP
jgi:ribosomal protein S18 acetylase RimI-like enzyme